MAIISKNISVMQQVRRINRELLTVASKCEGPIGDTLFTQAALVAAEQRSLAPVGDDENSGALRASIRVEKGTPTPKKAIVVKIMAGGPTTRKANYDYARAVEFGTQEVKAQPFFYPIWRARRKEVRAAVKKAIKSAVKQVFK